MMDGHPAMALVDLDLPPLFDTSSSDLIKEFFVPALSHSIGYDRGVGYFSSGWLRLAAVGMVRFAENGGRARWVTSPILDKADWQSLQTGDAARRDPVLHAILSEHITDLSRSLERETLSALAWMVADGILDFRIALPANELAGGDFHDKFGILADAEGNRVSFNGSYNDSIQGTRNYESIKVFCSWLPPFASLVEADSARFERLWFDRDPNVRIFDLPQAAREQILRLRSSFRPYAEPPWTNPRSVRLRGSPYRSSQPSVPESLVLRDYQVEAINAWFGNGCRGLLEMATGTGKTITALAASARLFQREKRLSVVIAVPYQHLVDQWRSEAYEFSYRPTLAYQAKASWLEELNHQIMEYNSGYRQFISVITTHSTFISPDFQGSISKLTGPALLVADEAHHLGAERSRQNYPATVQFRLALSATPDRWFDDEGTLALRGYFGDTVFSFPLERAIGVSLAPYYYHPHLVPLTDEELERYEELSLRIARLFSQEDDQAQEALKMLLIRRAELLNKASNKLDALSELVDQQDRVDHALFYCAPGQIDDVQRLVGWNKGLLVHRFTAEEDPEERRQLLADFGDGTLQALVAMKCLDEGVDVPSTRTAYILASSGNPREFIQRRGRILRKYPGKEFAVIHDLVAVPPASGAASQDSPTFASERSILRHELERFKEFANPALNKHQALDVIWDLASRYNLMDF
jgi:superfamily II DNA or RNA helicase